MRSTKGISTNVELRNVSVLDTKHAGVMILRVGDFTDKAEAVWKGGLLSGQSTSAVCSACPNLTAAGCHKKLSRKSYNREMPFTPSVSLVHVRP